MCIIAETTFFYPYHNVVFTLLLCTSYPSEVDLQHSAIWMAGVYLMLLMQFLENKVAVELTRSGFVEAQEVVCICYFLMFYPLTMRHILKIFYLAYCLPQLLGLFLYKIYLKKDWTLGFRHFVQ